MEKLDNIEEIERVSIKVLKIIIGKTIVEAFPQFVTDEVLNKKEELIRGPELGIYLYDEETKGFYLSYIKSLNIHDFDATKKFRLVVRNIRENEYSKRFKGRVYLEQKVEVGDVFYSKINENGKQNSSLYSKFLTYDTFVDGYIGNKKVKVGNNVEVIARVVASNNSFIKAKPLRILDDEEYLEHKERVFRKGVKDY